MRYNYFLEYAGQGAYQALDFLEYESGYDFDYEWEEDVLIIYTNADPEEVESMVYDATGQYANNYGRS
jgi:hypothetical protein